MEKPESEAAAGEREDATAVFGAVVAAAELVGDREPAGGRLRADPADADAEASDHVAAGPAAQQVPRQIGLDLELDAAEGERVALRVAPAQPAVRHRGGDDAEPFS